MRRTMAARLNVGRFTESARGGLESEWPHFCRPKLQSIRIVRPRGSIPRRAVGTGAGRAVSWPVSRLTHPSGC